MPPLTMAPSVLAINAGSATVKCALFTLDAEPRALLRGAIEQTGSSGAPRLLEWVDTHTRDTHLAAIGHRIVHGGARHHEPQPVTPALLDDLRQLVPFAPNHLPDEIALIEALARARPDVPQIVCFDTAFHHHLPEIARRLPIPRAYDIKGVRRYGFHGLSFSFLARELQKIAGPTASSGKTILAHLGNGSSLAAVLEGRSIDTSMSFTPIGGVVMSTRSGDLDPGLVTYLGRSEALTADQLEDLLSHRAGLLGISEATGDMRELLDREHTDPACAMAVAIYCYQIKKCIGGFAAALGGLDTLVFSGGIGEHAPSIRARICEGLEFLGVRLEGRANAANAPVISMPDRPVIVRVIPTDEELMIARAAWLVLGNEDA
jgi:acetate kinase